VSSVTLPKKREKILFFQQRKDRLGFKKSSVSAKRRQGKERDHCVVAPFEKKKTRKRIKGPKGKPRRG